ncbi:MAG: mechanosensitive ion channel family protein [Gemmatimonadota bacterium]|nr:mechanosensitive ion channel family protein [Gemmatimonadota bacterium]
MEILAREYLGNSLGGWLAALATVLLVYVGLRFIAGFVVGRLFRLAPGTSTYWDDVITHALKRTKAFALLAVAVFSGGLVVTLPARLESLIEHIAILAVLVQVGIWISAGIKHWIAVTREARAAEDATAVMTMNVIGIAARIVLWSMVLLLALDNWGVDVTALVAGLGVGGIAVALAAQNILGDLFASLSIVLDRPFVLGDFLIVDEMLGSVEEIGLKTTRIRSLSGEQLVFSNTDLLSSRIRNYGRMFERRVVFEIGVTYQTPREQLKAIPKMIRGAIEEHGDEVRFDRAHFKKYGDFALVFETVYYVMGPDYAKYMDIQQAVNFRVHELFEASGIEFAYPTQTLFVRTSAEAVS